MKKFYILAITMLLANTIFAQSILKLTPKDTFFVTAHPDSIMTVKFYIENTSTNALDVTWERLDLAKPASWDFVLCDKAFCYAPTTKKATINLVAGEKSEVKFEVLANSLAGNARVQILVSANGQATPLKVKMAFKADSKVGVNDFALSKMLIVPNPIKDFFTIKGLVEDVNEVQISDLTGKVIKNWKAAEGQIYDTNDLTKGSYFISFLDKNNIKLVTKKLVKAE